MQVNFKIVVLAGKGASTWILINALRSKFEIARIFVEDGPSAYHILRRRVRKLGVFPVIGQMLFLLFLAIQRRVCKTRIEEILHDANLSRVCDFVIESVDSVNSTRVCLALREVNPDVVIVNGSRILSKEVLSSCNAAFLNIHAGITPKYRGVHGGYWALVNGDPTNCGVTVHLVDNGIDTGGIVYQARIVPTSKDCFATYPYLQLVAGVPLMIRAIQDVRTGRLSSQPSQGASHLYYHPTIWGYLVERWRVKVR